MAFYNEVKPGDVFQPSAAMHNDTVRKLNSINGFRTKPFAGKGSGVTVLKVYNPTDVDFAPGTPVNFDNDQAIVEEHVPIKSYSDDQAPWGVLKDGLQANSFGSCIVSGPVTIKLSGNGKYVVPNEDGFELADEAPECNSALVLYSNNTNLVICLGAGGGGGGIKGTWVTVDDYFGFNFISSGIIEETGEKVFFLVNNKISGLDLIKKDRIFLHPRPTLVIPCYKNGEISPVFLFTSTPIKGFFREIYSLGEINIYPLLPSGNEKPNDCFTFLEVDSGKAFLAKATNSLRMQTVTSLLPNVIKDGKTFHIQQQCNIFGGLYWATKTYDDELYQDGYEHIISNALYKDFKWDIVKDLVTDEDFFTPIERVQKNYIKNIVPNDFSLGENPPYIFPFIDSFSSIPRIDDFLYFTNNTESYFIGYLSFQIKPERENNYIVITLNAKGDKFYHNKKIFAHKKEGSKNIFIISSLEELTLEITNDFVFKLNYFYDGKKKETVTTIKKYPELPNYEIQQNIYIGEIAKWKLD